MNIKLIQQKTLGLLLALLLVACGQSPQGTSGGTVTVAGVVDGSPEAPTLGGKTLVAPSGQQLLPGQVIQGQGQDQGNRIKLDSVHIRLEAKGSVEDVNVDDASLKVLGVTFHVDALTHIYEKNSDGTYSTLTLADLRVGDFVEVSAMPQQDGSLLATYIQREQDENVSASTVELRGKVQGLDEGAKTFTLNNYTVAYTQAQVKGTLRNEAMVEVEGTLSGTTSITASKVEVESTSFAPNAHMKMKGLVTDLDDNAKTFRMMDLLVDYSQAQPQGSLQDGARVEVEGRFENGRVLASEVKVKHSRGGCGYANREVKGALEELNAEAGTLRVGGMGFYTDANTVLERSDQAITLADLQVGEWVEVKYTTSQKDASGNFYATKIEAKGLPDQDAEVEIKGQISDFDSQQRTFTVNGYNITVNTDTLYEAEHGERLTAEQFFGQNRNGAFVEAKGRLLQGRTILATKIELK